MKKLLKGGRVIDPVNGIDGEYDVLIDGDRIARVGRNLPVDGATVVEMPRSFELLVNLRAAKEIGLAIPESFLVRADEVIE